MVKCSEFLENLQDVAATDPEITLPPELDEHQRDCDNCHDQLRVVREAWLLLPAALRQAPIRPELESAVVQRVTCAPPMAGASWAFTISKYGLAASVFILLLAGTLWGPHWLGRSDYEKEWGQVKELARQLGKLEQLERSFSRSQLRFVSLTPVSPQDQFQGYLVYDVMAKEAHFFGYDLVPVPGRIYKLWLLNTDNEVVGSAVVDVNSQNLGAAIVELANDVSVITDVVVSLESDAASVAPSGEILMSSKVAN